MKKLIKTFIFTLGFLSLPVWSMEESGKEEVVKKTEESAVQSDFEKVGQDVEALILSFAAIPEKPTPAKDTRGALLHYSALLNAFKNYLQFRKIHTPSLNIIDNNEAFNEKLIEGFYKAFSHLSVNFDKSFFAQLIGTPAALEWIKKNFQLTDEQVREKLLFNIKALYHIYWLSRGLSTPKYRQALGALEKRLWDTSLKWYDINLFDLKQLKDTLTQETEIGGMEEAIMEELAPENRQKYDDIMETD